MGLVSALGGAGGERFDELHIDLDLVAGALLFVALPNGGRGAGSAAKRKPAHVESVQDAPHAGDADRDVVVALQVHDDLPWPKVVVLPQVNDLLDNLGAGGVRAGAWPFGSVPQAVNALDLVAP